MTAYVIVQPTTSQDRATLLARPDVRVLLSAHGARALPVPPVPPVPAGVPAPAPVPLTLAVPDMAGATRLAAALRAHADVETAYAKPAEAAP